MNANSKAATQQQGFTIVQMMITLGIIAIVSTFGVLGIKTARAEFRLQSSARLFASYVEKARVDAIRRHAASGQESSIETFGPGTRNYAVTMDFGSGLETRTFELEAGMNFSTAAQIVTFDWRGRITEAWVFQVFSEYLERSIPVDVSGSGDITVGEQHFPDQLIPPVEISEVTGDVYPDPTPTASVEESPSPEPDPTETPTPDPSPGNGNGGDNGNGGGPGNGNGNPDPTPTPIELPTPPDDPGATPTPSPSPIPQCLSTLTPSTLSLSQSDITRQTGTAVFSIVNATGERTISATQVGNGNSVVLGLSLLRITGSGSSVVSVTTKQGAGNRGVFVIQLATSPSCGSGQQLTVSISN
jgi:type II secretory pathway pseudopilin PulG